MTQEAGENRHLRKMHGRSPSGLTTDPATHPWEPERDTHGCVEAEPAPTENVTPSKACPDCRFGPPVVVPCERHAPTDERLRNVPAQHEHRCSECPYCGPPRLIQGGSCPRCGAARTPDGFCSACFQRGLG